jgi:hypothetical protein
MLDKTILNELVNEIKSKQHKKRENYTINKYTIDRLKVVTDKRYKKNIKYS